MNIRRCTIKIILLIFTYIPSLTLFWKVVSTICGYGKVYSVFQFSFASYFTLFTIFLTKDIERFNLFWRKHVKGRIFFDKVLHFSAVFILEFQRIPLLIVEAISHDDVDKKIEISKQEIQKQINDFDDTPLAARTLFPVGVLTIIMIIFVEFNLVSEQMISWIQEILNTLVSVVGLIFVVANIKEDENLDQEE